jgi:hypothetical protein
MGIHFRFHHLFVVLPPADPLVHPEYHWRIQYRIPPEAAVGCFRFPSVIVTSCTGFFLFVIIKASI